MSMDIEDYMDLIGPFESKETDKIYMALHKFHSNQDTEALKKDAQGNRNKYASIEAIIDYITPKLAAVGCIETSRHYQLPEFMNHDIILKVSIIHTESQQFISSTITLNHPSITLASERGNPVHTLAGNDTYLRRYLLKDLLGLAINDKNDPDGFVTAASQTSDTQSNSRTITPKQAGMLITQTSKKPELLQMILNQCGVEAVENIPFSKFNSILKWIEGK